MQIIENANLLDILWYKIGGTAKYLLECSSRDDIIKAFEFIKKNKVERYFVVGLGSNLLFTDEYYDGAVVQVGPPRSDLGEKNASSGAQKGLTLIGKDTVEAYAGVELDDVIKFAFEHNLLGLEWAGGLPGTVGAAIRGNVGAFGGEIKDSFAGAEVLEIREKRLEISNLNRRDIKFGYRMSTVKKNHNMIVLSARFKLEKVDDAKLGRGKQTYFANIEYRREKHPLDHPSTGSAFKNINNPEDVKKVLEVFPDIESTVRVKWHGKISMGYLIKRIDLSGFQVGGAQISHKHGNFILNLGGASFSDVLSVIKKVQETFMDAFGFMPEPEVEIVKQERRNIGE